MTFSNFELALGQITQSENGWIYLDIDPQLRKPRWGWSFWGSGGTFSMATLEASWSQENENFNLFDYSGSQLDLNRGLAYAGELPLSEIWFNNEENTDPLKVSQPQAQRTLFDKVRHTLPNIDSDGDQFATPININVVFSPTYETNHENELNLYYDYGVSYEIITTDASHLITFYHDDETGQEAIQIAYTSTHVWSEQGFEPGQEVEIKIKDNKNTDNQVRHPNNGTILKVEEVWSKEIKGTLVSGVEFTGIDTRYKSTTFTTIVSTIKKNVLKLNISGESYEEDIRYKYQLENLGMDINPNEIYVFSEYDVREQGIDWEFLNRKRKELIMNRNQIWNYVGSYKAIINAINYFGYNDLILSEYFLNLDPTSPLYDKKFKVEIPSIFDNEVEGWEESDWVKNLYPNKFIKATNLFNLAYLITDKKGNKVLQYSVSETMIKLWGLKAWLERSVIPLTHNILDITGETWVEDVPAITHETGNLQTFYHNEELTPIDFIIPEAYVLPVTSGSSQMHVVLQFYSSSKNYMPDYYEVNVNTFRNYTEWEPFSSYSAGDIVYWQGENWESLSDDNEERPDRYKGISLWDENINYVYGQRVKFDGIYYQYQSRDYPQRTFILGQYGRPETPLENARGSGDEWFELGKWKSLGLRPVQSLSDIRYSSNLSDYTFTVDTQIDPHIEATVTSHNGEGLSWSRKRTLSLPVITRAETLWSQEEAQNPPLIDLDELLGGDKWGDFDTIGITISDAVIPSGPVFITQSGTQSYNGTQSGTQSYNGTQSGIWLDSNLWDDSDVWVDGV